MKVLVIGSGGREHAILWALKQTSKEPLELFCAPGNGGISELAHCVALPASDHASLIEFAHAESIDLTIVGPEGPLAAGIVEDFNLAGLRIFGTGREAARLESSKVFAKNFMRRHGIPTADFHVSGTRAEAMRILRSSALGGVSDPVVLKADGLAAGKGVIVASSRAEGERAIEELTSGSLVSSEAASQLLIEKALTGREVSVLLFADGRDYKLMPAARDHKRIGENDTGPNTGGMGAITDSSVLDQPTLDYIVREVVEPTLCGARDEGFPFKGILFIGLMLTAEGPKVLEYNVRFGDPETQAILMRLESDLFEIFQATVDGNLGNVDVHWSDQSSACVILASKGYPGEYEKNITIEGLDSVEAEDNLQVFHAGTTKAKGRQYLTSGGRVLGVTATAATLNLALERCYGAIGEIRWDGMQYRRDIGRFKESRVANETRSGG